MKCSNTLLYAFALVFCLFIQTSLAANTTNTTANATFPKSVLTYMATRQIRYHHYMWHQIRQNWLKFTNATQTAFRSIGWEPPSPARDAAGNIISTNFAGEDFLYMHRHMIQLAKQTATQNKESLDMLTSWPSVPLPNDTAFPVPQAFPYGNVTDYLAEYKTDDQYTAMKKNEDSIKNVANLKKWTLNDLGLKIENNIHNALHFRWTSSCSVGYRTGGAVTNGTPNISKTWDDVKYDWMGDSYASHVNPLFWRLHGWVDDRIEDWRKANNLTAVTFSGTWIGGPMANLGSVANKQMAGMHGSTANTDPEYVGDVLQKAFDIFQKSGVPEWNMADQDREDRLRRKAPKIPKKCTKKASLTKKI